MIPPKRPVAASPPWTRSGHVVAPGATPADRRRRIRGVRSKVVALVAGASSLLAAASAAAACQLLAVDHRSGRELLRAELAQPQLRIAFTHSVLGTPVEDHYRWRDGAWRLVEERFDGVGYGLPHAAAAVGETLERIGDGWRLTLDREVTPLVVRALPAQAMRVLLDDGRVWPLGELGAASIELRALAC